MNYEINEINQKKVVKIKESLVTEPQVREFREILNQLIDSGVHEIILDLSETPLIGSSGIGKLMLIYKKLQDLGGHIYAYGLNKDIHELFEALRLNELVQVIDTLE